MAIHDVILFGMLAGVVTLKVVLLAATVVLLVRGLTEQIRQRKVAPAVAAAKHPGLDVHA